jgi:exonuclease SbcD
VSFRLVHAADLHLDTPFAGLGRVAPAVAARLRDASLEAWDALVDLVLREGAACLLLAGDVYDGVERGLRAQLRVLEGLRRLSAAGVRTFLVHGNHDPLEGWSAVRRWPDGVHVFAAGEVQTVPVDGMGAVHGVSFGRREERRNLARLFRRGPEPGLHIALLHASVGSAAAGHEPYAPCSAGDLLAAEMDYWALGHVHRHQVVLPGRPWAAYPGCLQGRSPAPGEVGPKGALVMDCDPSAGVVGPPRFVPLDRVRFVTCDVEVQAAEDVADVVVAVREAAEGLRDEHGGRDLLVRLTLRLGEGALAADLRRLGADELLAVLRRETEGWTPLLWWESLRVESLASWDRSAVAARGDFAAELVRTVDRLGADPLAWLQEEAWAEAAAAFRRAGVGEPDGPEAREILAEAERRCLELLLSGDGPA